MTLPLRRKLQITACNTPRAIPTDAPRRRAASVRSLLAAVLYTATIAAPAWADLEPATSSAAKVSTSKGSQPSPLRTGSSNLKWRTPSAGSSVTTQRFDPFAEAPATAKTQRLDPFAETPATAKKPTPPAQPVTQTAAFDEAADEGKSDGKSALKFTAVETPAASRAAEAPARPGKADNLMMSTQSAPRETLAPATAKPINAVAPLRSRVSVVRLSEADPSPFSSGGAEESELIVKVSNEEPKLAPLVEEVELGQPRAAVRERAAQAGLQEPRSGTRDDPFANEPRPETQPPPSSLPEDDTSNQRAEVNNRTLPSTCPTPKEYVKHMKDISTNIAAEPGDFPVECGLGDEQFVPRNWQCTLIAWKASSLCHKPLYFEDVELERYGWTCSPLFQPIISATKFYLTLPILPYMMGLEPPCECIYPLGYYRPGSCAPFIIPPVPISLRGALLEAGVWVAGVALVP